MCALALFFSTVADRKIPFLCGVGQNIALAIEVKVILLTFPTLLLVYGVWVFFGHVKIHDRNQFVASPVFGGIKSRTPDHAMVWIRINRQFNCGPQAVFCLDLVVLMAQSSYVTYLNFLCENDLILGFAVTFV